MIRGSCLKLRRIRDDVECRRLYEAYGDLSQRAKTDHVEVAPVEARVQAFREHGMWTPKEGILVIEGCGDQLLGMLSFRRTTELECDIGYRILRNEHRKRGIMRAALPLFCTHLFDVFPSITRLQIRTADDNIPSRRLAEQCGFVQEGVLRKAYSYRGRICDWVLYGLLREEWQALKSS